MIDTLFGYPVKTVDHIEGMPDKPIATVGFYTSCSICGSICVTAKAEHGHLCEACNEQLKETGFNIDNASTVRFVRERFENNIYTLKHKIKEIERNIDDHKSDILQLIHNKSQYLAMLEVLDKCVELIPDNPHNGE